MKTAAVTYVYKAAAQNALEKGKEENMNKINSAGMAGKIAKAPEWLGNLYGRDDLLRAYVNVERRSGISDTVAIVFAEKAIDTEGHEKELEFLQPQDLLTEGKELLFIGHVQTMRNFATGQIDTIILCDYILTGHAEPQNEVKFIGTIERVPKTRKTPKGKTITDLFIRVPSEFEKSFYCIVPVIAWNDTAEAAANMAAGDEVEIEGRLQSREYIKRYIDGTEETRTATEVSAATVRKI